MITTPDQTQQREDNRTNVVEAMPSENSKTSIECLAKMFCEDAQQDTIHYLIRSNVSHDGE